MAEGTAGDLRLQLQDTCGSHDSEAAADPVIREGENATESSEERVCPLSVGAQSRRRLGKEESVRKGPVRRGGGGGSQGWLRGEKGRCVTLEEANLAHMSGLMCFPATLLFEAGSRLARI